MPCVPASRDCPSSPWICYIHKPKKYGCHQRQQNLLVSNSLSHGPIDFCGEETIIYLNVTPILKILSHIYVPSCMPVVYFFICRRQYIIKICICQRSVSNFRYSSNDSHKLCNANNMKFTSIGMVLINVSAFGIVKVVMDLQGN